MHARPCRGHSVGECLPPSQPGRHLPCDLQWCLHEAPMLCGTSPVRGGGGLKVHARPCREHSVGECLPMCMLVPAASTRFESACSPADQAGTCKRDLQQTLRKAATDGASFAAASRCKAAVDLMCMLVPAAGTRLESACGHVD